MENRKNGPQEVAQQSTWSSIREIIVLLGVIFLIRTFIFGLYQVPTGSMEVTMLVGERFYGDKLSMWLRDPKRGEIIAFNDVQYAYSANPLVRFFQEYAWGPMNLTKRVIGVPGDRVRGVIENGKPVIYVNDQRLDEPYLNPYPLLGMWKPNGDYKLVTYDPTKPYDQQPFYRIDPAMIMTVPQDVARQNPEFTITPEGHVLQMPGVPSMPVSRFARVRQGKSYWGGNSDDFYIELGPGQFWVMGDNRLGSKDSRSFGPITKPHARLVARIWSIDSDAAWWIVDLALHPIDFWKRMRWHRWFNWLS
jgi:signal peptidase I